MIDVVLEHLLSDLLERHSDLFLFAHFEPLPDVSKATFHAEVSCSGQYGSYFASILHPAKHAALQEKLSDVPLLRSDRCLQGLRALTARNTPTPVIASASAQTHGAIIHDRW